LPSEDGAPPVDQSAQADVSRSVVTPLEGTEPTTDAEMNHPLHLSIMRVEVFSENLGAEFMTRLKQLLADVRDEARKVL
jgi:hypothetical protein